MQCFSHFKKTETYYLLHILFIIQNNSDLVLSVSGSLHQLHRVWVAGQHLCGHLICDSQCPGQHQEHLHPQPGHVGCDPVLAHHASHLHGPPSLLLANQHLHGKNVVL